MASELMVNINKKDDSTVVVSPVGKVDSETYMEFEKLIQPVIDDKPSKVLVDMSKCDYISSAGIRVFFDFRKKIIEQKGVLSLYDLQPHIQKVFQIVKALPLECVFANAEDADAYLDRLMADELKKQSDN